jgi:hypothetical protein
MRGYSDTKPDGNPARSPKSLRRQFGEIYALNLDRNILAASNGNQDWTKDATKRGVGFDKPPNSTVGPLAVPAFRKSHEPQVGVIDSDFLCVT